MRPSMPSTTLTLAAVAAAILALAPAATLAAPSSSPGGSRVLKFKPDGTFQISIFEDMHYGEGKFPTRSREIKCSHTLTFLQLLPPPPRTAPSSYGPIQDAHTTRVMTDVLAAEPAVDLVVFNGDMISRESTFRDNSTHYLDQMLQPLADRGLPWATLYGNHDPGQNRSLADMLARERSIFPGSLTLTGPSSSRPGPQGSPGRVGLSNYWLPVYSERCAEPTHACGGGRGRGCAPELILWFFDSRSGFEFQTPGDGGAVAAGQRVDREPWVSREVVSWFEVEKAHIVARWHRAAPIPSLAFVHIPFHAFAAISNTTASGGGSGSPGPGIDPRRSPGINEMPITPQTYGWCPDGSTRDTAACPWGRQDVPFMRSLVAETPGLRAVFAAHIHGASWCTRWSADTIPEYPVQPPPGQEGGGGAGGLDICFGQHTGYGGAGDWVRGARQLLLRREQLARGAAADGGGRSGLDTWIRLETGAVVGSVSLNATFGQDEYPVTPVQKTFCQECKLRMRVPFCLMDFKCSTNQSQHHSVACIPRKAC
ncbi:metallophosphoesterase [Microdochium nivale]|nr:metallophosphoesterase [Microdochium nivale]